MDVVILCGGQGTRLKEILGDTPKALAPVGLNGTFLSHLLQKLWCDTDTERIILATGVGGDQIEEMFGVEYDGIELIYSHEEIPLGTAGALRNALPHITSEQVLVMNGDAWVDTDYGRLMVPDMPLENDGAWICMSWMLEAGEYGYVTIDSYGYIVGFEEKPEENMVGWINAGVYIIPKEMISELPEITPLSLEKEILPTWIEAERLFPLYLVDSVIDIGTPERYQWFKTSFQEL